MNILRKLATLLRAMASPGTHDRPPGSTPAKVDDAGVTPAVDEAQRPTESQSEGHVGPLDRSRVADLLDQQAQGRDMPVQRQEGDRS
jgi:hypothetical protein